VVDVADVEKCGRRERGGARKHPPAPALPRSSFSISSISIISLSLPYPYRKIETNRFLCRCLVADASLPWPSAWTASLPVRGVTAYSDTHPRFELRTDTRTARRDALAANICGSPFGESFYSHEVFRGFSLSLPLFRLSSLFFFGRRGFREAFLYRRVFSFLFFGGVGKKKEAGHFPDNPPP